MLYSKKQKKTSNGKKKQQTRNGKKKQRTRNGKKKKRTRNGKKKQRTRNGKKRLINYIGGKPYKIERLLIHVHRNEIKSLDALENKFNQQVIFTPNDILQGLQSFKIDKFSISDLINFLKINNKNIVIFSPDSNSYEYLVLYVRNNNLEYFLFSTYEIIEYINSNTNPIYTMSQYFGKQLVDHLFHQGYKPDNEDDHYTDNDDYDDYD